MKVIIVANQDEISKSVTEKGRELQYLVASDGREIVFESKSKQDEILEYYRLGNENSNKGEQKESISVEELTERVDRLFDRNLT